LLFVIKSKLHNETQNTFLCYSFNLLSIPFTSKVSPIVFRCIKRNFDMFFRSDNEKSIFGKLNLTFILLIALPLSSLPMASKVYEIFKNGSYSALATFDILRMEISFSLFLLFLCSSLLLKTQENNNVFRILVTILLLPSLLLSVQFTLASAALGRSWTYDAGTYFLYLLDYSFLNPTSLWLTLIVSPIALAVISIFTKWIQIRKTSSAAINNIYVKNISFIILLLSISLIPPIQTQFSQSRSYNALAYFFLTATESKDEFKQYGDSTWKPVQLNNISHTSSPLETKRNVVFIVLESVRASATSIYGKKYGDTTPFLKKLANSSLVAEQAITVVPHTSKSTVAINCGIEPYLGQPIFESTLGIPTTCLPDILEKYGYDTVFFESSTETFENRAALINNIGFNEYLPMETLPKDGFEMVNYFGYEDEIMLTPSKEWIKKNINPFFALYFTGTTHHGYQPPSHFPIKQYSTNLDFNSYLNSIRYIDGFIEKLFNQYKSENLYENTIFVIVADHGQGFGEHGLTLHSAIPYKEGLRVPLLIHSKESRSQPNRLAEVTSQKDIVATVLELLGISITGGGEGKSLFDKGERVAYSACWYDFECLIRTDKNHVYQHYFGHKNDELYSISNDPNEKINIAKERPDLVKKFRSESINWYKNVTSKYHNLYSSINKDYLSTVGDTMSFGFINVAQQYKALQEKIPMTTAPNETTAKQYSLNQN